MSSNDLVNAGFYGYRGWGDAEAAADFAATGGAGKGQATSGANGPGGWQPLSAPDLKAVQDKVYEQLKPYYMQLLKESNGDFDRAVRILNEDYTKGVRVAKEDYARAKDAELGDLKGSLQTLGINFGQEQEQALDTLNKRGMATYEMSPNGEFNVLKPQLPAQGSFNPASANLATLNPNAADQSGINPLMNMPNQANLGRGGYELNQLAQGQQLRQEAVQRTANNKLQQLGVNLTRYTNPNATDPSMRGEAELAKERGTEQETREKQKRGEDLYERLQNQTYNMASGFANAGIRASDADVNKRYNSSEMSTFVNQGTL